MCPGRRSSMPRGRAAETSWCRHVKLASRLWRRLEQRACGKEQERSALMRHRVTSTHMQESLTSTPW